MRKRLPWVFGAVCVLAVALGYLARPENPDDELAGMRRFHPHVRNLPPGPYWIGSLFMDVRSGSLTEYTFDAPPELVLHSLPGWEPALKLTDRFDSDVPAIMALDHHREAFFQWAPSPGGPRMPGVTCIVDVLDPLEPWYQRTWSTIKHRLGLR